MKLVRAFLLLAFGPLLLPGLAETAYGNVRWQSAFTREFGCWMAGIAGEGRNADGIGGLVAIQTYAIGNVAASTAFPAYDGNGNIMALIDASNGNSGARYEYGPFGELIRATGPMAKANPFRFSSKYTDDETDLVYYGYRYYGPSMGRWLSRDPIGEKGGLNLYGFCGNEAIKQFDVLGLDIKIDPNDPKHPGGKCSDSETCRDNIRLLLALIRAGIARLDNDFTADFRQKAKDKTLIPEIDRYNPNVTDYRTSWNNHRKQLINALARATECVSVIGQQMKDKKCGCCDWFDDKRLRWREQEIERLKQQVPGEITSSTWISDVAANVLGASLTVNPSAAAGASLLLVPVGEPEGAAILMGRCALQGI